ncbi:PA2GD phospholipase, partial [Campylorhamphus procurvoides]|nr:PA2GD phospholipase [Campylorhamphus procurvoides]
GLSPAHGNLFQLNNMITRATGKAAWLYYNFYGCYCGLGGEGQPKDDSDRCCQLHDTCYLNVLNDGCNAYRQSYHYSWSHDILSCGEGSWCAQLTCECDRSLALCLRRNVGSYNKRYQFYPNYRCK